MLAAACAALTAAAPAAPRSGFERGRGTVFRVTFSAELTVSRTTHAESVQESGCRRIEDTHERRVVTLESTRSTLLTVKKSTRVKPLGLSPARLAFLAGTFGGDASGQITDECPDKTTITDWDDGVPEVLFSEASVSLTTQRRGMVVARLRGLPDDEASAALAGALRLTPASLSEKKLLSPRTRKLVVQGTYPASGSPKPNETEAWATEQVQWTLTLTRR